MKLTVAIPSYNRNQILLENMSSLLPQMTEDCQLLIIDNCSDEPIADTLKDILLKFPYVKYRIIRNRVNIGAGANGMRCFELCESEWLWVLGDDDLVSENAVKDIFDTINEYPDSTFINFLVPFFNRKETKEIFGLDNFLGSMDYFNNILCLSVDLFNMHKIQANNRYSYQYGYQYTYSKGPHIALLIMSLSKNSSCIFSNKQIIDKIATGGQEDHWSKIHAGLCISVLSELPITIDNKKKLSLLTRQLVPLRIIAYELICNRRNGYTFAEAKKLFSSIVFRRYLHSRSLADRIAINIIILLIAFPNIAYFIMRYYWSLKGHGKNQLPNVSRMSLDER